MPQAGYLQELNSDAPSTQHKILQTNLGVFCLVGSSTCDVFLCALDSKMNYNILHFPTQRTERIIFNTFDAAICNRYNEKMFSVGTNNSYLKNFNY